MDETWLCHYDLETKQQSMELRHSVSHSPKNFERKNSLEKFGLKTAFSSLIIFQKAKHVDAEFYSSLLVRLKDILKETRRRNFNKEVSIL